MFLEIVFILAALFFIGIFFYKQALEDFDILQIESNQLEKLQDLIGEQSFVVVRSLPQIHLWTQQSIEQMKSLHSFQYGKVPLGEYLTDSTIKLPTTYPKNTNQLADITGVKTWIEKTWSGRVYSGWLQGLFSTQVENCLGQKGLRKTTAYSTMILPTDGNLIVSVMPEKSETYLPKTWKGRLFHNLTRVESPLIGEIKYVDIKVKEGSAVFLPPHWIVSIQSDEEAKKAPWFLWSEFHHPLSKLAKRISED
jgi:hypothetical protein